MLQIVKKEGECGGEVRAGTEEKRGEEMGERERTGCGGGKIRWRWWRRRKGKNARKKKRLESGGKSSGVRGEKEKDKGKIHHRMKFVEKRKQQIGIT